MISIRTVLCPVDFSPATARQVDVAADLCRAFGARLVLHHNVPSMGTVASVGWMWNADHPPVSADQIEARLKEHLARVSNGLAFEARITKGPPAQTVLAEIEAVDADLVVLSTYGKETDEHASVTEQVLTSARRSVLALHDASVEHHTPHFASGAGERQVILAPTDLTPEARAATETAFELARRLPVELHLLHLLPEGSRKRSDFEGLAAQARHELRALVPQDLAPHVHLHVEDGDPAQGIIRAAEATSADCIVMGEHTRAPIRRWLSRDTSRAVLREAPCPVWYIPGGLGPRAQNPEPRAQSLEPRA
jgi:nucleotide-binding universal stress UspA family protein